QLLEELRALREGVPAARLQPRGHQEVAGALRRGPGQRRGLDLYEVALGQQVARRGVDLAPQPQVLSSRVGAWTPQVQVTVAQPRLLTDVDPLVDLERQRLRLGEHLQVGGDDLDLTRGQVGVDVAVRARAD